MAMAKVVLVMGKGGVGKTTVARGIAHGFARAGERTVVLELGAGAGAGPAVEPGAAVHESLSEDEALIATAGDIFGAPRVVKLVFGNFAMKRLLSVVPGVREYCLIVAARQRLARYARVVVDMPATGHGIAWLSAARKLSRLVPHGRARVQADALDAALRDPAQTSYVLVSIPEPLVVAETEALARALDQHLGVGVELRVLNRVPSAPVIDDAELRALAHSDPTLLLAVSELRAWNDELRASEEQVCALKRAGETRVLFERPGRPPLADVCAALQLAGGVS